MCRAWRHSSRPSWRHLLTCPLALSAGLDPKLTSNSCQFALNFHPPVQDQASPPARRSVLLSQAPGPPQCGFMIKPFFGQLPKHGLPPAPPVSWLPGLAGPHRGPARQSLLLLFSPGQPTPPVHAHPFSTHQISFKHSLPAQDHVLKKDMDSFYFFSFNLPHLNGFTHLIMRNGKPKDKLQYVLCWWLSFQDLLSQVSLMRIEHLC